MGSAKADRYDVLAQGFSVANAGVETCTDNIDKPILGNYLDLDMRVLGCHPVGQPALRVRPGR